MHIQTPSTQLGGAKGRLQARVGETTMIMAKEEARPQQVMRGIAFIVAAMFVTSLQDVVFKFFSSELTLWQIFVLRASLAVPLLLALAWMRGMRVSRVLVVALQTWVLIRSLFMTLSFLAFYAAIPFLSLATVGAANYIAPVVVTLLSAYVISEPVGRRGWIGVLVGFAGVILLLRPGTDTFSLWALLPLLGACFYALSHVTTRVRCQSVPLPSMALSLNFVMLTAGLIVSGILLLWQPGEELARSYPYLFGNWSAVGISEWLVLGLLAVLTVAIGLGIAGAYQAAPPSIIATFEYVYLGFVALWDVLFFGISPNLVSIVGMVLIVGAGTLVLRRGSSKSS